MALEDLQLKSGTWLVSDCGKTPSTSNCQLVLMAPVDQKSDLTAAIVKHMVDKHGHEDNEELRREAESSVKEIQVS